MQPHPVPVNGQMRCKPTRVRIARDIGTCGSISFDISQESSPSCYPEVIQAVGA